MPDTDDLKEREAILAEIFGIGIPWGFFGYYGLDLTKGSLADLRAAAERFAIKDYARLLAKTGDNE